MTAIGIGVVGTGYMGKAHSVAMNSVGAIFDTPLKPVCEMLCATTEKGAAAKAKAYGFNRSTSDWQKLVEDPAVEAVVIASPQSTHREIALAAIALGKPTIMPLASVRPMLIGSSSLSWKRSMNFFNI